MVPANVTGPMYVFITNDQAQATIKSAFNLHKTKSPSLLVAGPALLFVNQPDGIGSLLQPSLNSTGVTTENVSASPMNRYVSISFTVFPVIHNFTGVTSALSESTHTSTVPTTSIPPLGVFTTTISPAQASALLSSLIG